MATASTRTHTAPDADNQPANLGAAGADDPKADSGKVKADTVPGLFVIVYTNPFGGSQLAELHSEETAAARVALLTYNSKQHRKDIEAADEPLPDGGGTHEINRKDIGVYRLAATEVTDF